MSRSAQPEESWSLVEKVYERTRQAILTGEYPPGQKIRMQDIAQQNGVSLIPVREAMRLLEAGRLVVIETNKGARVAPISRADVEDAYELRRLLEGEAVRRATGQIDEAGLVAAHDLLEQMVQAFTDGDIDRSNSLHKEFHYSLYRYAKSPWLMHTIEPLWGHTERYRRLATPARPEEPHIDAMREQHGQVLAAVESRKAGTAAKLMRSHLRFTSRNLLGDAALPGEDEK